MKNTVSYFKAKLRDSLRPLIYLAAISLIFMILTGGEADRHVSYPLFNEYGDKEEIIHYYYSNLETPFIIMIITAYIAAVWMFSKFMKRRNLDCYYSLPISRRAVLTVHYVIGLLAVYLTFTVSFVTNLIQMIAIGGDNFNYPPLIGYYFLCLLFGAVMYTVLVFVFCEGTTVLDGCIFMALHTFGLSVGTEAFLTLMKDRDPAFGYLGNYRYNASYLYGPLNSITQLFTDAVEKTREYSYYDYGIADPDVEKAITATVIWSAIWIVISALAAFGLYKRFGSRRPEATEEICESPFGYKTLIPYFVACLLIMFGSVDIILLAVVEIGALVGYTIYRRGFKYKKQDIIILAALIIFAFL